MKRNFSEKQRIYSRILSGNLCQKCFKILTNDFHADHIFPYSLGGKTILDNCQALCPTCNLKKSNHYPD